MLPEFRFRNVPYKASDGCFLPQTLLTYGLSPCAPLMMVRQPHLLLSSAYDMILDEELIQEVKQDEYHMVDEITGKRNLPVNLSSNREEMKK